MALLLFRFWPVLIPLLVYAIWHREVSRKAVALGKPKPLFRDGPWYRAVLASLLTGIICFIFIGVTQPEQKGSYKPAHLQDGVIVPGKVSP